MIKGKKTTTGKEEMVPPHWAAVSTNTIFLECFAGGGSLSKAVGRLGIAVEKPQDLRSGGIDFSNDDQLQKLWTHWRFLKNSGFSLLFHFAPPAVPSRGLGTEVEGRGYVLRVFPQAWIRKKSVRDRPTLSPRTRPDQYSSW